MTHLLKLAICFVLITTVGFSASAQNSGKLSKNNRLKSWFKKSDKTPIILQKTERKSSKTKIGKLDESEMKAQKFEQKTSTGKILRSGNSSNGKIIRNKNTKATRAETGMSKAKILDKSGRNNQTLPSKSLPAKSSKTSTSKTSKTKVVKAETKYPTKVVTKSKTTKAQKKEKSPYQNRYEKTGKSKVVKNPKSNGTCGKSKCSTKGCEMPGKHEGYHKFYSDKGRTN